MVNKIENMICGDRDKEIYYFMKKLREEIMGLSERERRKKTPQSLDIFKYWSQKGKLPPAKNDASIELEQGTCFACGSFFKIQRAHIIPLCYNGENIVENIHLLCASCHSISEGNNKYWNWITYMRTYEWKTRVEWFIKTLVANGVNIDEEAEKIKDLPLNDYILAIHDLARNNGIILTPKK